MLLLLAPAARVLRPGAEAVLMAAIVVFGLYMVYEIGRWVSGNKAMLTPGQFRRRVVTGLLLELDLFLWLFSDTLTLHRPAAERLLYLLFATLLVFIPMLLAVREAAFVMRQYARWRGEVVRSLGRPDRRGENGSAP